MWSFYMCLYSLKKSNSEYLTMDSTKFFLIIQQTLDFFLRMILHFV